MKKIFKVIHCMHLNECIADIYVDWKNEKITVKNYTDVVILQPFGRLNPITWKDFMAFIEEHVFSKERGNCEELLGYLGLKSYDPVAIFERARGFSWDDRCWFQFDDENLELVIVEGALVYFKDKDTGEFLRDRWDQ